MDINKIKSIRSSDVNKYFRKLMKGADDKNPDFIKLLVDEYKCDYLDRQTMDEKQINFYKKRSLDKQNSHKYYFSINYLVRLYINHHFIEKNDTRAKELAESLLIIDEYGYAAFNLGYLYNRSDEYRDYTKSKEFYEIAFNKNCVHSSLGLGLSYQEGHGVKQDIIRAKELYEIGASHGSHRDIISLAYLWENGYGVSYNEDKAIELYRSVIPVNFGYAKSFAAFRLGALFSYNDDKKNIPEAIKFLKLSIETHYENIKHAANGLGNIYYNEVGFMDKALARKYYELSYNQDTNPSNTLCGIRLGKMFCDGEGGSIDLVRAVQILSRYSYGTREEVKKIIYDIIEKGDMQTLENIVEVVPHSDFINVYFELLSVFSLHLGLRRVF